MPKTLLLTFFSLLSLSAFADGPDDVQNIRYRKQCLEIKDYIVKDEFKVNCNYNYHSYNADSSYLNYSPKAALKNGRVKIGSFNLLHPGSTKSMYKDYSIVAKIMNKWDVVAAVELLPVLGKDLSNNIRVVNFIEDAPELIKREEEKIQKIVSKKLTPAAIEKLDIAETRLKELQSDFARAKDLYRAPGYLKLLNELRKLDPSWALIVSPRGEAAKPSDVQELSGFYYRGSVVQPRQNNFCYDYVTNRFGSPVACIPPFTAKSMGQDYRDIFSRRPFMASFRSGAFDFTLLASHIVFNAPKDQAVAESMMMTAYQTPNLEELPEGLNKASWPRFAEVNTILKFMNFYRETYNDPNIMLAGDFNLESKNPYWSEALKNYPGASLLIDELTSLSVQKYDKSQNFTGGYASNYDHFVFDTAGMNRCKPSTAKRVSIVDGEIGEYVDSIYGIRGEYNEFEQMYFARPDGDEIVTPHLDALYEVLNTQETISRNRIVPDNKDVEKMIGNFDRRVFTSQLSEKTFYRLYLETISDHAPIEIECDTF